MRKLFFLGLLSFAMSCGNNPAAPAADSSASAPAPVAPAPTAAPAPSGYKVGDQLTALAKSGLVLREKPDATSAKITSIASGQKVSILSAPGAAFQLEAFPGFSINGNWVKVSAGGKEGYVFDGLLSSFDAPKETPFESVMKGVKSTKKTTSNPSEKDKNSNMWMQEIETFDNGVTTETQAYEGGATFIQRFPEKLLSLKDAYLLVNALGTAKGKWSKDKKDGSILFESTDGMTATSIKSEAGFIVVEDQTAD